MGPGQPLAQQGLLGLHVTQGLAVEVGRLDLKDCELVDQLGGGHWNLNHALAPVSPTCFS